MSLRYLTPLLALSLTGLLPAGDAPKGERPGPPPGPPPGALFERFDQDHNQQLSRPEFVRGMIALHNRRAEGGDRPRPPAEGEGRPPRDGEGRPPRDGEGRPPRDGENRPPRDDENRPPRPPAEGEGRPPRPPGEGEGRPQRPPGEGEGRPHPEGGGPLEAAFDKADADKSGSLSQDEFRAALQHLPRPPGQGQGEGDRPRPPKEK